MTQPDTAPVDSQASVPALPERTAVAVVVPSRALRATLHTVFLRSGPMVAYQVNRIGRTGIAGIAMTLFTVIFLFSAVLPQQRQLQLLDSQWREAHTVGSPAKSAPAQLGQFMSALPKRSDLPRVVGQVFTLAGASRITLDHGQYEIVPLRAGHMAQYRMTFPIKGRYPDIRKFIDAVLVAVPSASLEGLRMERKSTGEETVAADLRFSIFFRSEN